MKVTEGPIQRFLETNNVRFVIPVYQRNYDWKKAQCKQLLDDILKAGNEKLEDYFHFIGSIVYIHEDTYSVAGSNELVIIDGQQRLTTLMLIYISICRIAKQLNDDVLFRRINKHYLTNEFAEESDQLKLHLTENNDKVFRLLMAGNSTTEYSYQSSKMIENFEYINSRINADNYKIILQGLSKLIYIDVALERKKDDPQRIFESLNSTGMELSQADLIRNYVLMGLEPKDQSRLFKDYWEIIEQKAHDYSKNESKVSEFIRDFLTMESKEIPNKNTVYDVFKNKYPHSSVSEIESVLLKLKNYAVYYNKFINPENEDNKEIQRELKFIKQLEIAVVYPFLLRVYADYKNDVINNNVFIEALYLLQSFVWRRFVVEAPSHALSNIFKTLYEFVDENNYVESIEISLKKRTGIARFPNDNEVTEALRFKDMYNIQQRNSRYFLDKLENYNNPEKVDIDDEDITIEHIFPQNPDIAWQRDLGKVEYETMKEKYMHTIGNLTLTGNNEKLSNKSFSAKKELYKSSHLWLNGRLKEIDTWNMEELEKRFKIILERFFQIWKYPTISVDLFSSGEEVNIFQAEDPTNKKLEYAVFAGDKIKVKSMTDLYREIIRQLFELHRETFFSTSLANDISLVTKENLGELAQPAALGDTSWFIDTHSSSKEKFKKLKKILSIFEMQDDLLIKYS